MDNYLGQIFASVPASAHVAVRKGEAAVASDCNGTQYCFVDLNYSTIAGVLHIVQ
jgi:hypothetical protein